MNILWFIKIKYLVCMRIILKFQISLAPPLLPSKKKQRRKRKIRRISTCPNSTFDITNKTKKKTNPLISCSKID